MGRYETLLAEIHREFPLFRLVRKDRSLFQRMIHALLAVVTLGAQRSYLNRYQTTIGCKVYVTPDWDSRDPDERYVILRHERIHLRQFRRYGLLRMAVLYVLVPLPVGLAWFRACFEMEAYAETLRAAAEIYGPGRVRAPAFRANIIGQFTSGSYGWMWPFRGYLERWYDAVLATLEP